MSKHSNEEASLDNNEVRPSIFSLLQSYEEKKREQSTQQLNDPVKEAPDCKQSTNATTAEKNVQSIDKDLVEIHDRIHDIFYNKDNGYLIKSSKDQATESKLTSPTLCEEQPSTCTSPTSIEAQKSKSDSSLKSKSEPLISFSTLEVREYGVLRRLSLDYNGTQTQIVTVEEYEKTRTRRLSRTEMKADAVLRKWRYQHREDNSQKKTKGGLKKRISGLINRKPRTTTKK